jgi:hypothetical protein
LAPIILFFGLTIIFVGPIFSINFIEYPDEDTFYPIWSYDLFARMPKIANTFTIVFYQLGDRKFPEGLFLKDLVEIHKGAGFNPSVLIDSFGKAILAKNQEQVIIFREKFEKFFLRENSAIYDVEQVKWKPIDLLLENKYEKRTKIGSFTYER